MTKRRALYLTEFKTCSCTQVHRHGEGLGYCRRHGHGKRRTTRLDQGMENKEYARWESERSNDQDGFAHVG